MRAYHRHSNGLLLPEKPAFFLPASLPTLLGFDDFGAGGRSVTDRSVVFFNGTPGGYTFTVPSVTPYPVTEVDVFLQGPGGMGYPGNNPYTISGGGSGGGFAWRLRYPVTPGASINYVVGGAATSAQGAQQASTSFDNTLFAEGGRTSLNGGQNIMVDGGAYSGLVTGGFVGGRGGPNQNSQRGAGCGGGAASFGGNGTDGGKQNDGSYSCGSSGGGAKIRITLTGNTYTVTQTAPGQGGTDSVGGNAGGDGTAGSYQDPGAYPGYGNPSNGPNYGAGASGQSILGGWAYGGPGYIMIVY